MSSGYGGNEHDPKHDEDATSAAESVSPELVRRFQELVEEVILELMQGGSRDRHACREDAVALLLAASRHLDGPPAESPLMHLLLQEQQRAALALWRSTSAGSRPPRSKG